MLGIIFYPAVLARNLGPLGFASPLTLTSSGSLPSCVHLPPSPHRAWHWSASRSAATLDRPSERAAGPAGTQPALLQCSWRAGSNIHVVQGFQKPDPGPQLKSHSVPNTSAHAVPMRPHCTPTPTPGHDPQAAAPSAHFMFFVYYHN